MAEAAALDRSSPAPEELSGYGVPVSWSRGQAVLHTDVAGYRRLVEALREDGFNVCVDVCATDYLAHPDRPLPEGVTRQRFELVVNLLSHGRRQRVRIRVQVPEADPVVQSLFDLYPGTEAMERETFDMMGIVFSGHPDLTRILMPEDWEGHPLRKDYAVGRVPVQFKGAPSTR
ncbi:MAG TPA: NADH-quinone oxidoreductase subunit C [Acidimicrobiales bacterium]|nr:NADH-quinone oxidoreductase subunit C [Acidimicrobiales bacterium]